MPLGEYEPAARRYFSIYAFLRSKHSIVIGNAEPKSVRAHVCVRNISRFVALRRCRQNPLFGQSNIPQGARTCRGGLETKVHIF